MLPGYHTAGLLQHDLAGAIEELAAMGYRAVAVRPQHGRLSRSDPWFGQQLLRLADVTARHDLQLILDLDTCFLHNAWKSRGPALASAATGEARAARDGIETWLEIAAESKASMVTFACGQIGQEANSNTEYALTQLACELDYLVNVASELEVAIALRPRHGDSIATVAQWERLRHWLKTEGLGLAADIGEMLQGHEIPLADRLERNRDCLSCIYICDRSAGQTKDQPIGTGDIAHDRLISGLVGINFQGPAIIRIDGHSQLGLGLAEQGIQIFDKS
ncbi:sugar phosphate isomerase/epimerase [Rhodopirellula sp.]|nr:sugar phosphate isomerase/epimerase [Rhodopirellula sp.]